MYGYNIVGKIPNNTKLSYIKIAIMKYLIVIFLISIIGCSNSNNNTVIETQKVNKYYENGNLKYQVGYKDGQKEGIYKEFYKNGNIRIEVNFISGQQEGILKKYYKNGQLEIIQNWNRGLFIGEYKQFDTDGILNYHGEMVLKDDLTDLIYPKCHSRRDSVFDPGPIVVITNINDLKPSYSIVSENKRIIKDSNIVIKITVPNIPSADHLRYGLNNGKLRMNPDCQGCLTVTPERASDVKIYITAFISDTVVEIPYLIIPYE